MEYRCRRFLVVLLVCLSGPTQALACGMLAYTVDDARSKLRRAANESDFDDAKDYARRAKSALDDAAMSAMNCDCQMAYSEFDSAASKAKRARDADTPDEFVDELNRSIRYFNSAISYLQTCTPKRR